MKDNRLIYYISFINFAILIVVGLLNEFTHYLFIIASVFFIANIIIIGYVTYKNFKKPKELILEKDVSYDFLGNTKVIDNINNLAIPVAEINKKAEEKLNKDNKSKKLYQDYTEGSEIKETSNVESNEIEEKAIKKEILTKAKKERSKKTSELEESKTKTEAEDSTEPIQNEFTDASNSFRVETKGDESQIDNKTNSGEVAKKDNDKESQSTNKPFMDEFGELSEEDEKRLIEWEKQEAELLLLAQKEINEEAALKKNNSTSSSEGYSSINTSNNDDTGSEEGLGNALLDQILAFEQAAKAEIMAMEEAFKDVASGSKKKKTNKKKEQ